MGIENLVFQTYNSTGPQSVGLAIEPDNCNLIKSQFLTNPDTQYLNGTGVSVVQGQSIVVDDAVPPPDNYNISSEFDAISDIIYTGLDIRYIRKIDVLIGSHVETIFPHDIMLRNITELNQNFSGGPDDSTDRTFSIPFPGRAKDKRNCHLQAGATTKEMSLKVSYKSATGTFKTSITVVSHKITNAEKSFIYKNPINRHVHTCRSVMQGTGLTFDNGSVTADLSSIGINVSHILIYCTNLESVQLILGNERTDVIPSKSLNTRLTAELFSLSGSHPNLYIIKLADRAFSTAGIPFSRLNYKKLKLTASLGGTAPAYVTCAGTEVQTVASGTISYTA